MTTLPTQPRSIIPIWLETLLVSIVFGAAGGGLGALALAASTGQPLTGGTAVIAGGFAAIGAGVNAYTSWKRSETGVPVQQVQQAEDLFVMFARLAETYLPQLTGPITILINALQQAQTTAPVQSITIPTVQVITPTSPDPPTPTADDIATIHAATDGVHALGPDGQPLATNPPIPVAEAAPAPIDWQGQPPLPLVATPDAPNVIGTMDQNQKGGAPMGDPAPPITADQLAEFAEYLRTHPLAQPPHS